MNFLDRRTRINILQQRANEYNEKFDQLEQEGYDLDEIPKIISEKEKETRPVIVETLPFEENKKVIGVGNAFQQGYQGSHKVMSSTKSAYQEVDKLSKLYKTNPNAHEVQEFKEKYQKQKQVEKLSKQEIQKDHLTAMLNIGQKIPKSNFKDTYCKQYNTEFTDQFQSVCDKQTFEYNYKQNDLKQYAEEYVKSKANLRKC